MKRLLVPLIFLLVLSAILLSKNAYQPKDKRINNQINKIINNCRNEKIKDNCYASEFAYIAKNNPLDYTLNLLDKFQKAVNYPSCHFLGHVIANEEINKNPKLWIETLTKFPADKCSGGFLMGSLEEAKRIDKNFNYDRESITALCKNIQKIKKGTSDQTCVHTIGHLILVEKIGDIDKSISICGLLDEKYQYECLAGIFMENEYKRNLIAMGIAEKINWNQETINKHVALCKSYLGLSAKACWREISHMFLYISEDDTDKVYDLCNQAILAEEKKECYLHAIKITALTESEMF